MGHRNDRMEKFTTDILGNSECDPAMGVCGPIAPGGDPTVVNNPKDWKASYTDEERQIQFDNSETGKKWANYLNRSTTPSTIDKFRRKKKRSKPHKESISLDTGIGTSQWHSQSKAKKKKIFQEHFAQQPEYRRTIDKEDVDVMSKKEKKLYYKTRDKAKKKKQGRGNTSYTQKKTRGGDGLYSTKFSTACKKFGDCFK